MAKRVAPDSSAAYPLPLPMEIMLKIFGYVSLTTKQILELKTISRLFVGAINGDFIGGMAQKYNGNKENQVLFSSLHDFLDGKDKTRQAFAQSIIKYFSTSASVRQIVAIIPPVTPSRLRRSRPSLSEEDEARKYRISEEMFKILSANRISKMVVSDFLEIERVIKYFPSLKQLVWRMTNLVEDYVHLPKLTALDALSIEGPPNPPSFGHENILLQCTNLTDLTRLTVLDLKQSSGSKFAELTRLTKLVQLTWGRAAGDYRQIDRHCPDLESKSLFPFTNLRKLTLVGFSITDAASIKPLEGMHLTSLELLNCPNVTDQALKDLKKAVPDIQIDIMRPKEGREVDLSYLSSYLLYR